MMMYQVYSLTDDGFEQSLGYFPDIADANIVCIEYTLWRPTAEILIRKVY